MAMAVGRAQTFGPPERNPIPWWQHALAILGLIGSVGGVITAIFTFISYDRWQRGRNEKPYFAILFGVLMVPVLAMLGLSLPPEVEVVRLGGRRPPR